MVVFLALMLGVVAGLRTMTAPAAVSWAARLGWLSLGATPLWWLGHPITPWVFTVLALGEYVTDQLPSTPSRVVPPQFAARVVSGGLCGAAVGISGGVMLPALAAGVVGAIAGTLGGRAGREALATAFGHDRPAAVLEDVLAIALAALTVRNLP